MKISKVLDSNYFLIGFLGLIILISYSLVQPKYSFMNDSLIKLIQAESLKSNKFNSEAYSYFFSENDPEHKFFPIDYSLYLMEVKNKFIGPFPVSFSFITAIFLYFISFEFLPFLSLFFVILSSFVAILLWKLSIRGVVFLFLCTSINISYLEYSENSLYILMVFSGISFFLFGKKKYYMILAGIILGFSVYLRLETLLYLPLLGFSFLIFKGKKEFFNIYNYYFIFTFLVVLFFFFWLNSYLYDHFLGPRFIIDEKGFFQNLNEKIDIYLAILFGSKFHAFYKLGFLGLTPIFIFTFVYGFFVLSKISSKLKIFLLSSFLYILLAPLTAPHDGHWSWGARYLNPLIYPMVILTDKLFIQKGHILFLSKKLRIILVILVLYSFVQSQIGMGILHFTSSITKKIQKDIENLDKNSIILVNSGILALNFGSGFIGRDILNIPSKESTSEILSKIKIYYPNKTIYFIYSKPLADNLTNAGIELVDPQFIKDELNRQNFKQTEINSKSNLITINELSIK